jgi:hypothetical protein
MKKTAKSSAPKKAMKGAKKSTKKSMAKKKPAMKAPMPEEGAPNPVTTMQGMTPAYGKGGKNWIKGAIKRPGAFTKKAKAAGMSVSAYANKVTKKGSTASTTTKRQANLAKTLSKMRKRK